jgi:hypothetical protein
MHIKQNSGQKVPIPGPIFTQKLAIDRRLTELKQLDQPKGLFFEVLCWSFQQEPSTFFRFQPDGVAV